MGETRFSDLPSFEHPPVVEVAVGIEFLQLPGLGAVRLVGLHELWETEFPKIQEQPALPPTTAMNIQGGFQLLQIGGGLPPLRVWMLNEDEDELLQVQNDRLLLNWRKSMESTRPYPRYEHLREVYQRVFASFQRHIEQNDVGTFQPHAAVVTYVNRFALETGESLKDAFAPLNPTWEGFPGSGTEVRQIIPLSAPDGNRIGQVATVAGIDLSEPIYGYLEVVTRIDLGNPSLDTFQALDIAHEAGVRSFVALTTPKMHERWGMV